MRFFGYPYNDLVICKDSPDYLPECIVEAGSLNIFKNSLDRLWSNQDLLYNYRGVIEKKDNVF